MRSKLYFLLFTALVISMLSCKTASKLYQKGNYDEAVQLAAKKLQKDPNDRKLLDIISESYRYAVNDHESEISDYAAGNNELKWEWMYNEYASLQKMHDAIYKVPSVYNLVRPTDYSSYLVTYAEKAADVRYERGMTFMQQYSPTGTTGKHSFRQAYREFQKALLFRPADSEITQRLNEAYSYAVTNVVIRPMQQYGGYVYSSYQPGADNLDDRLIRDLQFGSGSEFVRYYSVWEARRENIRVDQELELRLARVDIGHYYDTRNTQRVSKEVVIKEIVYRPDSIVKEYGKVYADITTTRRTKNSGAVLEIIVRDADGRWLWSDHLNSDHVWTTEFATFTGDERALSDADRQLVNRRKEFAPTENEIMRLLLDDINHTALSRIRNYFIHQ